MLNHGGNLREAAQTYGIPLAQWLDLSTGINPQPYPAPSITSTDWQRLPEDNDGLNETACAYYDCQALLPTAGSQAALQILPTLRDSCHVVMPRNMYQEHAHAWQQHGHQVTLLADMPSDADLRKIDVLLLCNPNNPTGQCYASSQLLHWHKILSAHGGWLIVDEAFMDTTPENSIAKHSHLTGLIVLRSLGKFFGLAGARVGFLLAEQALLKQSQTLLGPWSLTGPSRKIAKVALQDATWHQNMRLTLTSQSQRLQQLLSVHGLTPNHGTALFQYVLHPQASTLHHQLAKQGIWVRLFEVPQALRFGLPTEHGWQALDKALAQCMASDK